MVVLRADHGGFCPRETVTVYSEKNSTPYHDHGCCSKESVDYALFASKVAYDVAERRIEKGILRCGTGIGISIAADKVRRIRVAVCINEFCAETTRRYNDASILCMGGCVTDREMAVKLAKISLETPFDGGRHARRAVQIKEIENGEKLQRSKWMEHQVSEVTHPLTQHKLTPLRDKNTGSKEFRSLVDEVVMLMCYEAIQDLPLKETQVETPAAMVTTKVLSGRKLAFVPILRAGLGVVDAVLELVPITRVGHIGLYRDHEILQSVEYYSKFPQDINERDVIVLDLMLTTDGSAVDTTNIIGYNYPKGIKFMCVTIAPKGVEALSGAHPDVPIYRARINDHLNEPSYIVSGLGDAGDQTFDTL